MAAYTIWIVEALNVSISGGKSLSGFTQGDASHLAGETITLDTVNPIEIKVRDTGQDRDFDDNDSGQRLRGTQEINGTRYKGSPVFEAEYTVVLRDPSSGIEYTAVGVNVRDTSPSYATVEGLAFVGGAGGFPPAGVALEVIATAEGPGDFGQPSIPAADFAYPICFTPGTAIATPMGDRRIERLQPGDFVLTRDHGPQVVRWIGVTEVGPMDMAARPAFHPVRIAKGALGGGLPERDLVVSQQHRILVSGWKAELLFGAPEVLVAAKHLIGRPGIGLEFAPGGITYIHLMLDHHEIVSANGAPSETFLPGKASLAAMSATTRAELFALFPELREQPLRPARRLLAGWEGSALSA